MPDELSEELFLRVYAEVLPAQGEGWPERTDLIREVIAATLYVLSDDCECACHGNLDRESQMCKHCGRPSALNESGSVDNR